MIEKINLIKRLKINFNFNFNFDKKIIDYKKFFYYNYY